MAAWDDHPSLLARAKSYSYYWNCGEPDDINYHIPMPKADGALRAGCILRATGAKIENYRLITTPGFRDDCFRGKSVGIPDLPHPCVLADELSAEAWMDKFSKAAERNICHVPEQAICFVEGMPLLVPFQDSRM